MIKHKIDVIFIKIINDFIIIMTGIISIPNSRFIVAVAKAETAGAGVF